MAIEADQWNGIVVEIVFLMTGFDRERAFLMLNSFLNESWHDQYLIIILASHNLTLHNSFYNTYIHK